MLYSKALAKDDNLFRPCLLSVPEGRAISFKWPDEPALGSSDDLSKVLFQVRRPYPFPIGIHRS